MIADELVCLRTPDRMRHHLLDARDDALGLALVAVQWSRPETRQGGCPAPRAVYLRRR
jgi:hypothetical protein